MVRSGSGLPCGHVPRRPVFRPAVWPRASSQPFLAPPPRDSYGFGAPMASGVFAQSTREVESQAGLLAILLHVRAGSQPSYRKRARNVSLRAWESSCKYGESPADVVDAFWTHLIPVDPKTKRRLDDRTGSDQIRIRSPLEASRPVTGSSPREKAPRRSPVAAGAVSGAVPFPRPRAPGRQLHCQKRPRF